MINGTRSGLLNEVVGAKAQRLGPWAVALLVEPRVHGAHQLRGGRLQGLWPGRGSVSGPCGARDSEIWAVGAAKRSFLARNRLEIGSKMLEIGYFRCRKADLHHLCGRFQQPLELFGWRRLLGHGLGHGAGQGEQQLQLRPAAKAELREELHLKTAPKGLWKAGEGALDPRKASKNMEKSWKIIRKHTKTIEKPWFVLQNPSKTA